MHIINTRVLAICYFLLLFGAEASVAQSVEERAVVINEIQYRPPDVTLEFVELYNRSERVVDLSEFQISDDGRNPVPITDEAISVAPGSFAVLVRDGSAFSAAFPEVGFVEPDSWPILRQTGDTSILYHRGQVIDSVGYEPDWGGYDREKSLERIDPNGPSNHHSNFGSSDGGPTPGAANSIFAPNEAPPVPVFAEADSSTVRLFFDEPVDAASAQTASFQLPGLGSPLSVQLQEQDTRVILDYSTPVEAPFIQIDGLRDQAGNTLHDTAVDLAFPPDVMKELHSGDLVVNEILYAPKRDEYDGEPDQVEYIELLNTADRLINLTGLHRTNRATQHGEADTTWFAANQRAVAPGEYVLLHATRDGIDLAETFSDFRGDIDRAVVVSHPRVQLGLRASGDVVKLHRGDGSVIDSVAYKPQWHHSQLEETTGISLERIWPAGNPNDGGNWSSSLHRQGGTPAAANSAHHEPDAPESEFGLAVSPLSFAPEGGGDHQQTAISYRVDSQDAMVRIRIYDAMGRLVRNLEPARPAGQFEDAVMWDGRDEQGEVVRLGIYVVHLEAVLYDQDAVETYREPVVVAAPFR